MGPVSSSTHRLYIRSGQLVSRDTSEVALPLAVLYTANTNLNHSIRAQKRGAAGEAPHRTRSWTFLAPNQRLHADGSFRLSGVKALPVELRSQLFKPECLRNIFFLFLYMCVSVSVSPCVRVSVCACAHIHANALEWPHEGVGSLELELLGDPGNQSGPLQEQQRAPNF